MGDLALVLAVICFWTVVAGAIAYLVRYTATSRDAEEEVCDLSESYYAREAAPNDLASAT